MTPSDSARRRDEEEDESRGEVVGFIPGCNEQAGCQCRPPLVCLEDRLFRRWLAWGMRPQLAVSRPQEQPAEGTDHNGRSVAPPAGEGHNPRFLLKNHKMISRL